jgi:hypothetical protein
MLPLLPHTLPPPSRHSIDRELLVHQEGEHPLPAYW